MHRIRQKIKTVAISVLLISGAIGFVPLRPAQAATMQPPGTCFYNGPNGSKTASCKSMGITTDPNNGNVLDLSKCYEVDATTSSEKVIQVNCDDTSTGPAPVQMCPNDKAGGPDVPCITCPDGITQVASNNDCPGGDCSQGLKQCSLMSQYINPLINFLAALVGVVVVISIIIGGIQYGSSAGDPQAAAAAKARIRNAILALVTFIFLYALLNFLIPGGLL